MDLWSFDVYLEKVISRGLKELADTSSGYPPDFPNFKSWKEFLLEMSDIYNNRHLKDERFWTGCINRKMTREQLNTCFYKYDKYTKDRMKKLIDHWGSLWD